MKVLALALVLAACGRAVPPAPGTPDDLAAYLRTVAGADEATRKREVSTWILDEPTWRATIVDPYVTLWPEYVQAFSAAQPVLVARLAERGDISARRHWAGDPRGTRAQARVRWALPVQYPSAVAELSGGPIDTVFIYDGAKWRALAGLDELIVDHVRARDPECAVLIGRASATGRCAEIAAVVAESALRTDQGRFTHACRLAATLCGNASP